MRWSLAVAMLCAAAVPAAAQHGEEKEKPKNPAIGNPAAIEAGKKLFAAGCAACHGPSGEGGRGPNLRKRTHWHPLDDEATFKVIRNGAPGTEMPPSNLPEEQIWQLTAFVRSLTTPAIETGAPGDAAAGESIFWGKAGCGGCHRIRGRGGMLGPDLTNIAAVRSLEDLRESVLDPDADGAPNYRGITVVLKDGRTIRGVARNRTNYSVQVQDAGGNLHLLQAAQVRDVKLEPHSPMPKDFKGRLNGKDLEDLLAFLGRQSVRPAAEPEKK